MISPDRRAARRDGLATVSKPTAAIFGEAILINRPQGIYEMSYANGITTCGVYVCGNG